MEQFSIGLDFEGAATRRDKRERFDPVAEFKNFGRQTDGLRRVVSNHAVFDRDFGLHPSSFPEWKLPMRPKPVKAMRRRSVVAPARPGTTLNRRKRRKPSRAGEGNQGSPRLVRISSLFSLLSSVPNLGLTISRGSWRLSAFGATTRAAAKIIRENDK